MIKKANTPAGKMTLYVAFLRALYSIHQHSHWKSKGSDFYGNHLLFQRLYDEAGVMVDEAAEKTIGVFGELLDHSDSLKELLDKYNSDDHIKNSLDASNDFINLSQELYDDLKGSGDITLGLDDMLMSIANRVEVHTYLLKQMG